MILSGNPSILIFDSGVGGLSVMEEIQRQQPGCDLTYASDNAAFPYGTKGEEELVDRVEKVLHSLLARVPTDIIVVACNSASTLALPHIRARFAQPIVGVVPAIKPAAERSINKVIGLLATPGTIARSYTRELISEFAGDCSIISLGSSELVSLAEQKLRGIAVDPNQLAKILEPMNQRPERARMDTVVLACTHFPLLKTEFAAYFGPNITLIDSGEAIARRVQYWVEHLGLKPGTNVEHQALFTEHSPAVEALKPALAQRGISTVEVEPVPLQ